MKKKNLKVTCTFVLNLSSNLNENQIKDRIADVINDFHSESDDTSIYFDEEEVSQSELESCQVSVSKK